MQRVAKGSLSGHLLPLVLGHLLLPILEPLLLIINQNIDIILLFMGFEIQILYNWKIPKCVSAAMISVHKPIRVFSLVDVEISTFHLPSKDSSFARPKYFDLFKIASCPSINLFLFNLPGFYEKIKPNKSCSQICFP